MSVTKAQIGFRKTALQKQGAFKPAKEGLRAGVGVVKDQPKKTKVKASGKTHSR